MQAIAQRLRTVRTALLAGLPLALAATPSLATAPVAVPEPGTLSLLAGGVAAAVIAYRLRKRR